ncbi:MAG: site-2 protease family protein [Ruminococcaceae bacterium]|nr:site-2 protease family protein [Oscillospiraceae bacterium]
MLNILLIILVFGVLIFIHEFGHFITARLCGVSVKEFAVGMGPTVFSWHSKKYGTKYGLRLLPIGGFVSMVGEDEESEDENAFCNKSIWKRMLIVSAGPSMNLLLGFVLMTVLVFSQGTLASTTIAQFEPDSISQQQLQVGDEILKVDGTRVHTGNELVYEIMNQGYEPIDLQIRRNGEVLTLEDVSFPTMEDSGASFGDYDFLLYAEETNLPNLLKHAFFRSVSTVKMVLDSLIGLLSGRFGMEAVSGPVGVTKVVGDAARVGFMNFLYIVTVLTINLGVFNLIPFPALDGGRFLFLIIEGIRRKPINRNVEAYINFVGIVILFAFMIFVTIKDIFHLFS